METIITTAVFLYRKGVKIIKNFLCKPFYFESNNLLSYYPESLKSLLFGGDLTLLLEQYRGQFTTIALKLCLQSFRHLRHKSLYVLLPVLGLMNNAHSCFNFFDNLAIVKTPFTHLDKGCRNAHPKSPDFKNFFITPSLV